MLMFCVNETPLHVPQHRCQVCMTTLNLKSLILASCNHILTVINCMSEKTYFDVSPINTEFPFKYLRIIYFVMILPSPSTIYLYSSSNEKWRQKCALQPPQQKHRNKNLSLSLCQTIIKFSGWSPLYSLIRMKWWARVLFRKTYAW